jgi:hypothetical protein
LSLRSNQATDCANPDDVYPRSGRLSRRRSDAGW